MNCTCCLLALVTAFSGAQVLFGQAMPAEWPDVGRKLAGAGTLRVSLLDGLKFRAPLVRVEDEALVVRRVPALQRWAISATEARIPRTQVVSLQRTGRHGHGRVIGILAGAAVMALVTAFPAKDPDSATGARYSRGTAAAGGAIALGLGALVGFVIDKPYPELRPRP
jgi:hypothetical protein